MGYDFSDWQVTPKRKRSELKLPLSLEDKIDIFYERTDGWQLEIAERIIRGVIDQNGRNIDLPESAYAVLHIVFSFFETIARYQDGNVDFCKTGRYFKKGLTLIFPEIKAHPDLLDELYHGVRCGLYHSGWTNPNVFVVNDIRAAIGFTKQGKLLINPQVLTLKLREYLKYYVEKLRDASNVKERENFAKRFNTLNKLS
jgi:hypothetical protein